MKKWTVILIVAFVALISAVDVYLLLKGYEFTISANVYHISKGYPVVTLAFGIVCGHLFWPNMAVARQARTEGYEEGYREGLKDAAEAHHEIL